MATTTIVARSADRALKSDPPLQPWIGGEARLTGTALVVLDPATGLPIAEVGDTDPADPPVAVDAAAAALPGWAATPSAGAIRVPAAGVHADARQGGGPRAADHLRERQSAT